MILVSVFYDSVELLKKPDDFNSIFYHLWTAFDISADLTELGKTPVAVVCAGAKSILDIELTLEYLVSLVSALFKIVCIHSSLVMILVNILDLHLRLK